jgi:hypothetical protein
MAEASGRNLKRNDGPLHRWRKGRGFSFLNSTAGFRIASIQIPDCSDVAPQTPIECPEVLANCGGRTSRSQKGALSGMFKNARKAYFVWSRAEAHVEIAYRSRMDMS